MRLALVALATLLAAPALAAEPLPSEVPMATSSRSFGVAEQIDAYLSSSPALADAERHPLGPRSDRQPHGEVAIGAGTGGYRSVYARTDLPVGETGWLSLGIEDSRFGGSRSRRSGYGPGVNARFGRSSSAQSQRCGLELMTPTRPLDGIGGPHGRCDEPATDR